MVLKYICLMIICIIMADLEVRLISNWLLVLANIGKEILVNWKMS